MEKRKPNPTPLREGVAKNNQVKPKPNVDKTAILKPPPAIPKKKINTAGNRHFDIAGI